MRNSEVAERWAAGRPGGARNFHTNGLSLYSYDLLIGYTQDDGDKVVINYCGAHAYSATTTQHVYLARCVADADTNPTPELAAKMRYRHTWKEARP